MANLVGQNLGRYKIIEQLGQGGMATVYRAYDTRLEREVAIKVIRPEQQDIADFLKRFEREAKALAKLSHFHIVKIHDYGEQDGRSYLVMEYIPGGTLRDRMAGKPIPYPQAARWLAPIARALEYAHQQGIIHRDVKPANMLFNEHGDLLLSDFGIARQVDQQTMTGLTVTGASVGTPDYMAPEQWEGKPTTQSDIYALGAVFFELVTGKKPFGGDTPARVFLRQITEALPSPRLYNPDLPQEIEWIVNKAMAKRPEERYASMGDLATVLEGLIQAGNVPAVSQPGVPPQKPQEPVVQNRAAPSMVVNLPNVAPSPSAPAVKSPATPTRPAAPAAAPEQRVPFPAAQVPPGTQTLPASDLPFPPGVQTEIMPRGSGSGSTIAAPPGQYPAPPAQYPPQVSQHPALPIAAQPRRRRIPIWVWVLGGMAVLAILVIGVAGILIGKTLVDRSQSATQTAQAVAAIPVVIPSTVPTRTPHPTKTSLPTEAPTAELPTVAPPAVVFNGEIKIAVLAPLSGPFPTFGTSTVNGMQLAVDEWNVKGGLIGGARIMPIIEDSQCAADPAGAAAKMAIDQGAHYIIGEVCSKASIPVAEVANANHVIQISPASTNTLVTVDQDGKVRPYTFRACFTDPYQGRAAAAFAHDTLKAQRAFVMTDPNDAYVDGLANAFSNAFKNLGGQIVKRATYSATDTDFNSILDQVKAAKPDVIYLPDYYTIVNLVTDQAKVKGILTPFIGGDGWDSIDLNMKAAEGSYFTNHYSPDDTRPEVVAFVKAYGARYKDDQGRPAIPDALAALAYDSTNLMLQAIQQAGVDNTAQVLGVLKGIHFPGVTGMISFDDHHNPTKLVTIMAVRNGKVEFFTTVNP